MHIEDCEKACQLGFQISNGPLDGCWIARLDAYSLSDDLPFTVHKVGEFAILETNDNIESCEHLQQFDLVAFITSSEVQPLGRARYWLDSNGTVDRTYFQ